MPVKNKIKGRGTSSTVDPRYLVFTKIGIDDGWFNRDDENRIPTTVTIEKPKSIIARNQSPDIPFDVSINPYRGCEHGCIYCYARPTHAYMDLSPGIDFETKLFAKPDAATLLQTELRKKNYRCSPMALGTNTDPYQPVEREYKITRSIIEVLSEYRHPLMIVTKSWLVERDIDLLAPMAEENLVQVFLSVTTLDVELARKMEPRTTAPARRIQTINRLVEAGIPTGVMFAPVIPVLNDHEMETVLEQAAIAGAESAGYVMIRLPHEIKILFSEWLSLHFPLKAQHVVNRIKDIRGGKDNDPRFKSRMRGEGIFSDLISKRFHQACNRFGLNKDKVKLDTRQFTPPSKQNTQLQLFQGI